jgi:hypothetical protein
MTATVTGEHMQNLGKDFTYSTCQPCKPPKRHAECHINCPGYLAREEQKQQRYAATLAAERAIPEHRATKQARNSELRRSKSGRNPKNR